MSELESLFSATVPKSDRAGGKSGERRKSTGSKTDKVHLVMLHDYIILSQNFLSGK